MIWMFFEYRKIRMRRKTLNALINRTNLHSLNAGLINAMTGRIDKRSMIAIGVNGYRIKVAAPFLLDLKSAVIQRRI